MSNKNYLVFLVFLFVFNVVQGQLYPKKLDNGKYGFVNKSSSIVISPEFDKAFTFESDKAKVIVKGSWGLIDVLGSFLVKPKCDYIGWANDGYFQLNKNNLTLTNNRVPARNVFLPSQQGIYAYLLNNKWGLIKESGALQKNEWDSIRSGNGGNFPAYRNNFGWTWINFDNQAPKDLFFKEVKALSNGILACKKENEETYTLYSKDGVILSATTYRSVENLNDKYIKGKKNRLWILLDQNGKQAKNDAFEDIKYADGNKTMQYLQTSSWVEYNFKTGKSTLLNLEVSRQIDNSKYLINRSDTIEIWDNHSDTYFPLLHHDSAVFYEPFYHLFKKSSPGFSLLNEDFGVVVNEQIVTYKYFAENDLLFYQKPNSDQWYLLIPKEGKLLLSNFEQFKMLSEILSIVQIRRKDNFGIYDCVNQEWIVDPTYKKAGIINDSILYGLNSDSVFLFNTKGNVLNSKEARDISVINDTLLSIKVSDKGRLITNLNFTNRISGFYNTIVSGEEMFVRIKKDQHWGLLNLKNGNMQLMAQYDTLYPLCDNFRILRKGNLWGIVNEAGFFTFKMSDYYQSVSNFESGRAKALRNGLAGLIDHNGTLKISTQYEDFGKKSFSHIPFKFRSKWGLLDEKERFVVQPLNDSLKILTENFVQVWKNGKTGIIDFNDKKLIEVEFDSVVFNEFSCFIVYKNSKVGFYNSIPRQIRPPAYDEIKQMNDRHISVRKNDQWQLLDLEGKPVLDIKFRFIYADQKNGRYFYKESKSWIIEEMN